jgi:hypothetical protein
MGLPGFVRVVTVGYRSNVSGIFDLGWGDADLIDSSGTVDWRHWEPLLALASGAPHAATQLGHGRGASDVDLRSAPPRTPRFDEADLDDLDLPPRSPLAGEPEQDVSPPQDDTGTEDDQP